MVTFQQLVRDGVAKFEYKNLDGDQACTCPICREYNNVYALATDTHMHCLEDGRKVITGQLIKNKTMFDSFLYACVYKNVDWRLGSPSRYFYDHQLKGHYDILNGDDVYILDHFEPETFAPQTCCPDETCKVCAIGRGIPESIRFVTTDGDMEHITECWKKPNPIQAMNESKYIKGSNWYVANLSDGDYLVESQLKIMIR